MNPPPSTLLLEEDLDGLTITLGPAGILDKRPYQLVVAGLAGGFLLSPLLGPILAGLGSLAVGFFGGWLRIRAWVRDEAPLHLRITAHTVELRRVFQDRLLHLTVLPLAPLVGSRAVPDGIEIHERDRVIRIATRFRSPEELAWVARTLDARIRAAEPGGVDWRLDTLRHLASS